MLDLHDLVIQILTLRSSERNGGLEETERYCKALKLIPGISVNSNKCFIKSVTHTRKILNLKTIHNIKILSN